RRPLRLRLAFGLAAPLLAVGLVVGLAGPRIDEASRVLTELGGAKPLLFRLAPVLEEGHRDAGPYEERRRRMALERVRDALPSVLRSFADAGMLLVASKEVDHIVEERPRMQSLSEPLERLIHVAASLGDIRLDLPRAHSLGVGWAVLSVEPWGTSRRLVFSL